MNKDLTALTQNHSIPLLKALHILTREGNLNADSRRKLKQVKHLSQLIQPLIEDSIKKTNRANIVDLGAGKSYLGFILYDLILKHQPNSHLTSVESRLDLIDKTKKLAFESGFERMEFLSSTIEDAKPTSPVDIVCALHACDTATDDAILFGLKHGVRAFALVPCCQAEAARELGKIKLAPLYQFPLHRREFGSHLTNVIRTLFLKSKGYQVTVTELVGWEHSLKNEILIATKVSDELHPESRHAHQALKELMTQFPISIKLLGGAKIND